MQQNLRSLFDQALADEPPTPPGDPVRHAMTHGRRIRRRRSLLIGGSAATAVVAATVALNLALAPSTPPLTVTSAAMVLAPAKPTCTWPVQDNVSDVTIFLNQDITDAERSSLRRELQADPAAATLQFESRQQAYEKFRKLWHDSPDFVASVHADELPESFRLQLRDPTAYARFAATYQHHTGVQDIIGRACPGAGK